MVAVEEVPVGSVIVVRPGERLPARRRRRRRRLGVDQAAVTGEGMPVDKAAGDEVFAGTLNQFGVLEVRTTRDAASSTIGRIVELVEQAQAQPVAVGAHGRPVRPRLHADRARRRRARGGRAGAARRRRVDVAVPRAGAADRGLPVLAGDLDPGRRRLGHRRRGARRHPDQGRRGAGEPRAHPRRLPRQDRDGHRRRAEPGGIAATALDEPRRCASWPPSSGTPSTRSGKALVRAAASAASPSPSRRGSWRCPGAASTRWSRAARCGRAGRGWRASVSTRGVGGDRGARGAGADDDRARRAGAAAGGLQPRRHRAAGGAGRRRRPAPAGRASAS